MILFAALPVADYPGALAWYERFTGRPPDLVPNDTESCWQVAEGGWFYVIEDAARAGRGLITLVVEDLDAELATLGERGIEVGELRTIPGVVRQTRVSDPEGNTIGLGQPLG